MFLAQKISCVFISCSSEAMRTQICWKKLCKQKRLQFLTVVKINRIKVKKNKIHNLIKYVKVIVKKKSYLKCTEMHSQIFLWNNFLCFN